MVQESSLHLSRRLNPDCLTIDGFFFDDVVDGLKRMQSGQVSATYLL